MAYITLLPKKDTPLVITDYRPVALQHSVPKLIAKVLATRLQPMMVNLVDQMQSGFIKGNCRELCNCNGNGSVRKQIQKANIYSDTRFSESI